MTWEELIERGRVVPKGQDTEVIGGFIGSIIKSTMVYLWKSYISISKWLFMILIISGIIAVIIGWKKGKYISLGSAAIYIVSMMINGALSE